jgi:Bacterial Ig-like domain (group 3)
MTRTLRHAASAVAAAVLAGAALLSAGGAAHATNPPPWEPDPNSVGGLIFYNASGDVITGGNVTDDPIAAYVEGTKAIRSGDTKATLFGYLPVNGVATGSWSGDQLSASTAYPNASDPGVLGTTSLPVVAGSGGDLTIADLISDYPNNDTSNDGYANLYQLRLKTAASGQPSNVKYDSADILITGTGDTATWSVDYSNTQVSTKTTLKVSPSGSALHGASVKLTATVSPAAAGSVAFLNGSKVLKTVTVSGGKATYTTKTLKDATYKLKATFTPTDTTAYTSSTSSAHSLKVKAHATKVTLKASATSIKKGGKLTLTIKESPAVAGKVAIYDGTKKIGTVKLKKGKATFTTTSLKVGSHKLKAKFTPKNTQNDAKSSSKTVKVKVTA